MREQGGSEQQAGSEEAGGREGGGGLARLDDVAKVGVVGGEVDGLQLVNLRRRGAAGSGASSRAPVEQLSEQGCPAHAQLAHLFLQLAQINCNHFPPRVQRLQGGAGLLPAHGP